MILRILNNKCDGQPILKSQVGLVVQDRNRNQCTQSLLDGEPLANVTGAYKSSFCDL